VRVLTSAFLGAPDVDSTDYNILAASEMDARVMAFILDGGLAEGTTWVGEDTLELVKQHTRILR
jgi:hypothetical protein